MFGLEGCGFVLSISVTFLLVGLVVYLFKKQLKSLEQKFIAIFQLSQTLATSVDSLRQNYAGGGGGGTDPQHNNTDTRPDVVLSDSESESESESEDEEENQNTCPFPNVKIVDLEKEPLKEHMLSVFNFDNNEMNKILDVTDINSKNGDDGDDEDDGDDGDDEGKTGDETEDTDTDDDTDTDSDPVIAAKHTKLEPCSPNYKGMKVPDLRVLIKTKKIETDKTLKSLKKQELIDILKKTN